MVKYMCLVHSFYTCVHVWPCVFIAFAWAAHTCVTCAYRLSCRWFVPYFFCCLRLLYFPVFRMPLNVLFRMWTCFSTFSGRSSTSRIIVTVNGIIIASTLEISSLIVDMLPLGIQYTGKCYRKNIHGFHGFSCTQPPSSYGSRPGQLTV